MLFIQMRSYAHTIIMKQNITMHHINMYDCPMSTNMRAKKVEKTKNI